MSSVDYALRYKKELEAVDPSVTYLMTLYLGPDVTPAEIAKAADAGVVGGLLCRARAHALHGTLHCVLARVAVSSIGN